MTSGCFCKNIKEKNLKQNLLVSLLCWCPEYALSSIEGNPRCPLCHHENPPSVQCDLHSKLRALFFHELLSCLESLFLCWPCNSYFSSVYSSAQFPDLHTVRPSPDREGSMIIPTEGKLSCIWPSYKVLFTTLNNIPLCDVSQIVTSCFYFIF